MSEVTSFQWQPVSQVVALSTMPPRVRRPDAPSIRDAMEAEMEWESWKASLQTESVIGQTKKTHVAITPPEQIIRPYVSTPPSTPFLVRPDPVSIWEDPVVLSLQPTKPQRGQIRELDFVGAPTQTPPKRVRVSELQPL